MSTTKHKYDQEARARLRRFQEGLLRDWVEQSLPDEWDFLDSTDPVERPRSKITLRIDTEMLRWFRKLGPGYQQRLNDILFIYWRSLLSGEVKQHWDNDAERQQFIAASRQAMEAELRLGKGE